MQSEFLENISKEINFSEKEISELSPLVLAYIGDSVYETAIRTYIVKNNGKLSVNVLNRQAIEFVKAHAQSDIIHNIMDSLNEDEQDIVRRGRNSKSGTIPKNANLTEYKYATGFEALIGYVYLKKDFKRLSKIFEMALDANKKVNNKDE